VLQLCEILVLNGKWMVLLIIVLSSSVLVVFLGDNSLLPLRFLKGFFKNHGWMLVFPILGFN
jgi:hypothetical protein